MLRERILKWRKSRLRAKIQRKLQRMTDRERSDMSYALIDRLERNEEFRKAEVVMLYYPIGREPDLRPLLEKYKDEKVLLLPVAHRTRLEMRRYTGRQNLHRGRFGIPEPRSSAPESEEMSSAAEEFVPSLIIVPGVAFDRNFNRLGRGGGYYDRFLRHYGKAAKYAVAYDFQVVKSVPVESTDTPIDGIITPGTEFVR